MKRFTPKTPRIIRKIPGAIRSAVSKTRNFFKPPPKEEVMFDFGKTKIMGVRYGEEEVYNIYFRPESKNLGIPAASDSEVLYREVFAFVLNNEFREFAKTFPRVRDLGTKKDPSHNQTVALVNYSKKDITFNEAKKRIKKGNYFLGKNSGKYYVFFTDY